MSALREAFRLPIGYKLAGLVGIALLVIANVMR